VKEKQRGRESKGAGITQVNNEEKEKCMAKKET
jgi:hypothetical protein